MILYSDDYIKLEENESQIYLRVSEFGMSIQAFNKIVATLPRVQLTAFQAIKVALDDATNQLVQVGKLKDVIELSYSSDMMYAYMTINLPYDTFRKKEDVKKQVSKLLSDQGVVYGIDQDLLDDLPYQSKVIIAKGLEAKHGLDARVSYYELSQGGPLELTNGQVSHYDLDLIDNVEAGTWLGKKVPATAGINGRNIKDEPVFAKMGRNINLKYDKKTVNLVSNDDGTEELFAKINGAVKFNGAKIMIDNHLIIKGDVDYNTGHVDFDGYVTITGTVQDKFNVTATYDISINGPMGIGAVGLIESKKGNVLIKGGVNGKGLARVKADKDVITKYANETYIEAGHNIHIGLYAIDSELNAKKIILPPKVGKIIGGKAFASHRIETGSIGNQFEKPTRIFVEGFERQQIIDTLTDYKEKCDGMNKLVNRLKKELNVLEKNMSRLDERAVVTYDYLVNKYEDHLELAYELELELERLKDVLLTKGEGEISIYNSVYPKTLLEIKKMQKRVKDETTGSFYVKDRTFHHNM